MNGWGIAAIVVSILTLAFSVAMHLVKTTWWMATLSANLEALRKTVESIQAIIMKHEATYYSKEDAAKDFAYRDQRINAAWEKIDELSSNGNGHRKT